MRYLTLALCALLVACTDPIQQPDQTQPALAVQLTSAALVVELLGVDGPNVPDDLGGFIFYNVTWRNTAATTVWEGQTALTRFEIPFLRAGCSTVDYDVKVGRQATLQETGTLARCVSQAVSFNAYPESDPCEYVGATNDWMCHSAEQSMRKRNDRYINHGERCIQEGPDQWGHYIVNCPDPK